MKLIFIIGSGAVGKMTVGQELCKITYLRLFHNHMSIEFQIEIFGEHNSAAIAEIREAVFREFAKSGKYGMVFTYMWAFEDARDREYVDHVVELFRQGAPDCEFYCVELVADREVRRERNRSENRLLHKPSKRNIAESEARNERIEQKHRLESLPGEIPFDNYMKIDNTKLSAADTALMIKEYFSL